MNYFQVYRLTAKELHEERVDANGGAIPETEEIIESNAFVRYVVYEWEGGDFAPNQKVYEGDEGDMWEQILADHPVGEWQNNDF